MCYNVSILPATKQDNYIFIIAKIREHLTPLEITAYSTTGDL